MHCRCGVSWHSRPSVDLIALLLQCFRPLCETLSLSSLTFPVCWRCVTTSGGKGSSSGAGKSAGANGGKKKTGKKAKAGVNLQSLPQYCGGGDGFADITTVTTKAIKALKLTHASLWVRGVCTLLYCFENVAWSGIVGGSRL